MSYLDRAGEHIFPYSEEKEDIRVALQEWAYHGVVYDLDEPCETCKLCGHPDIRYQFEIENNFNRNTLLIGSECIRKFQVGVIVDGETVTGARASRKVHSDKRNLMEEVRKRKMLSSLVELALRDKEFELKKNIEYVLKRGAFTPKQLVFLVWRFEKNKVDYDIKVFKVYMKRKVEKYQCGFSDFSDKVSTRAHTCEAFRFLVA